MRRLNDPWIRVALGCSQVPFYFSRQFSARGGGTGFFAWLWSHTSLVRAERCFLLLGSGSVPADSLTRDTFFAAVQSAFRFLASCAATAAE